MRCERPSRRSRLQTAKMLMSLAPSARKRSLRRKADFHFVKNEMKGVPLSLFQQRCAWKTSSVDRGLQESVAGNETVVIIEIVGIISDLHAKSDIRPVAGFQGLHSIQRRRNAGG